jgi:hypothetical protein
MGLIEPMLASAGVYPLALCSRQLGHRTIDPLCLENPRPAGAESTLAENVYSPFHAEPVHFDSAVTAGLASTSPIGFLR